MEGFSIKSHTYFRVLFVLCILYTVSFFIYHYFNVQRHRQIEESLRDHDAKVMANMLSYLSEIDIYLNNSDKISKAASLILMNSKWVKKITVYGPEDSVFYTSSDINVDRLSLIKSPINLRGGDGSSLEDDFIFMNEKERKETAVVYLWYKRCESNDIYRVLLCYIFGLILVVSPVFFLFRSLCIRAKYIIRNIDIVKNKSGEQMRSDKVRDELGIINEGIIEIHNLMTRLKSLNKSANKFILEMANIAERNYINRRHMAEITGAALREYINNDSYNENNISCKEVSRLLNISAESFDIESSQKYEFISIECLCDILNSFSDSYSIEIISSTSDINNTHYIYDNGSLEKVVLLIVESISKKCKERIKSSIRSISNGNSSYVSLEFVANNHEFTKDEIMIINDIFEGDDYLDVTGYMDGNFILITAASLSKEINAVMFIRNTVNGSLIFNMEIPTGTHNSICSSGRKKYCVYTPKKEYKKYIKECENGVIFHDFNKALSQFFNEEDLTALVVFFLDNDYGEYISVFKEEASKNRKNGVIIGIFPDDYDGYGDLTCDHIFKISEIEGKFDNFISSVMNTKTIIDDIFH